MRALLFCLALAGCASSRESYREVRLTDQCHRVGDTFVASEYSYFCAWSGGRWALIVNSERVDLRPVYARLAKEHGR